jgi:hypothetical protein
LTSWRRARVPRVCCGALRLDRCMYFYRADAEGPGIAYTRLECAMSCTSCMRARSDGFCLVIIILIILITRTT